LIIELIEKVDRFAFSPYPPTGSESASGKFFLSGQRGSVKELAKRCIITPEKEYVMGKFTGAPKSACGTSG